MLVDGGKRPRRAWIALPQQSGDLLERAKTGQLDRIVAAQRQAPGGVQVRDLGVDDDFQRPRAARLPRT
jgi:hypothetical protein